MSLNLPIGALTFKLAALIRSALAPSHQPETLRA